MTSEKEKTSTYFSGNTFYIVHNFNDKLRDGIIIPLTDKIESLSKQKDAELIFYINSHGGDAELCLHIISLIELAKRRGITVKTVVPDLAFSAGSLVAISGTKGHRYIARTAEHCVHYGSQWGWVETTPLQIERNTEHKKRHFQKLISLYKKYSNIPDIEKALMDDSYFLTAKECIKYGLADKYMENMK